MSRSSDETEAWVDGTRVTGVAGAVDKPGASGLARFNLPERRWQSGKTSADRLPYRSGRSLDLPRCVSANTAGLK